MDDAWKKEKLSFVLNWHSTNSGGLSISMNCQVFILKVKPYLCCHQSPKRGD
jgi:hypothetical protein